MNNIPSLKEQRAMRVAELRAIASKEANGGTIDDNERARFDELEAELRGLDDRLRRAETVAEYERRMMASLSVMAAATGISRLSVAATAWSGPWPRNLGLTLILAESAKSAANLPGAPAARRKESSRRRRSS
jgi:hypothetical protein